jgi:uncharacterized protein (DUF1499 family)
VVNSIVSIPIVLFVISVMLLTILSCASKPPKVQLVDVKLRPCPSSPNCVSSESDNASSRIEPLTFQGKPEKAWEELKETIREMGGKIQEEHDGYLWATFTSKLFRFVDDMEFRSDKNLLRDGLNIQKRKQYVKKNRPQVTLRYGSDLSSVQAPAQK